MSDRVKLTGLVLADGTDVFLALVDNTKGYVLNEGIWVTVDWDKLECISNTAAGTFRDPISRILPASVDLAKFLPMPMAELVEYVTRDRLVISQADCFAACAEIDGKAIEVTPFATDQEGGAEGHSTANDRITTSFTLADQNRFGAEVIQRAMAIKAEYNTSECSSVDVDHAVERLENECAQLFRQPLSSWEFINEEEHEEHDDAQFARSEEIRQEYRNSGMQAADLQHAIDRLSEECPDILFGDESQFNFLHEEEDEENAHTQGEDHAG